MKNVQRSRRCARVASAVAAAAISTARLTIPAATAEDNLSGAKDLLSDNVHNVAGGGVNIHADDTCVEKIGDTAHVKFMVQHQPLAVSSDHGQTAAHGTLALPRDLKNVSIKLKAVGGGVTVRDKEEGNIVNQYREATVFDTPLDIPIREASEAYDKEFPYGPPTLGGVQEKKSDQSGKSETDPESVINSKKTTDPDNPNLERESTLWTEQEVRDFVEKYNFHMKKTPQGFDAGKDAPTVPFMAHGSGDTAWYGEGYSKDYDSYEFGNIMMPVTFEVEGDVPVEHEDTFVTAATSNLGWKSSMESYAGNYEMGSQSLQEYQWARPNQLPPAIPSDPDMIQLYKDKLTNDGLDISPTIAPTREMPESAKYKYIGSDARPSARGDAGQNYTRTFTLHANAAVRYEGQVDTSAEDGADITAAHVTLCDKTDDENPPVPGKETDTPETETPEKETETPEKKTDTPEKDTETPETETPEKETETPETETPENETPEKDTETPETETPEKETPETETTSAGSPGANNANGTGGANSADTVPQNDAESNPQRLASTGANVIGFVITAAALMAAGIFLIRRNKA